MIDEHAPRGFLEKLGVSPRAAGITRVATIIVSVIGPVIGTVAAWQFNRFATAFDGMEAAIGTLKTAVALLDDRRDVLDRRVVSIEGQSRAHDRELRDIDHRLTVVEGVSPRRGYVPPAPGTPLDEPWNKDRR